uniref:Uncharacterized protein n=1 Tax=Lepeophtheirus salmonis TaxID=72036 RepID=A0A0K2U632_LEPSM
MTLMRFFLSHFLWSCVLGDCCAVRHFVLHIFSAHTLR